MSDFEKYFIKGHTEDTESPIVTCRGCGVVLNDFVSAISLHIHKCEHFPINRRVNIDISMHDSNKALRDMFTDPKISLVKNRKNNILVLTSTI